jgi:hypothetical protein
MTSNETTTILQDLDLDQVVTLWNFVETLRFKSGGSVGYIFEILSIPKRRVITGHIVSHNFEQSAVLLKSMINYRCAIEDYSNLNEKESRKLSTAFSFHNVMLYELRVISGVELD